VFDSQPSSGSASTSTQPTPYKSVFDAAPGTTVRYQGEDAPPAEYCLNCHQSPYLQMSLPDGEVISVTVDEDAYKESVHGQHGTDGYRCIRCHVGMNEYPHAPVAAQTSRELVIELSTACARCHTDKYDETRDDLHVALLARGVENAATCADCHTAHEVQRLSDATTGEKLPGSAATAARMCSGCHSEIYAEYTQSVHGQSVLNGSNDAATCADCHGVHNTQGPSTSPFLLFSPQKCATCHADTALMAKYDISTDVFSTYVADFHGTTVSLFQATAPDQSFNAPVCADCHGVHNIMAVENADSPVIKDNLINTCRRCHPSATTNFSSAWLSHYPPSFERTPIVALANLAYTVAIPAIVGILALFVIADARRRRSEHEKEH
jgi:nitrate/TMAO reductase-like tetraheme cytochrome c subunit